MLQTNQVDVAKIQEVRRLSIGSQRILGKLEAHSRWVAVAFFRIVDWQREEFDSTVFRVKRVAQIGRECRDATFARQIVPNHSDAAGQHWPWEYRHGSGGCLLHYEGTQIDHFTNIHGVLWLGVVPNVAEGLNSVFRDCLRQ